MVDEEDLLNCMIGINRELNRLSGIEDKEGREQLIRRIEKMMKRYDEMITRGATGEEFVRTNLHDRKLEEQRKRLEREKKRGGNMNLFFNKKQVDRHCNHSFTSG